MRAAFKFTVLKVCVADVLVQKLVGKFLFQSSLGDFYNISATVRSDLYNNSNTEFPDFPQYAGIDGTHSRLLPKLALDWRLPFLKSGETTSQVIEPMFSIIVAPTKPNLTRKCG